MELKWYNKYSKDLRKLACEKVVKLNGSENCSSVSLQCTSSGVVGSLLSSTRTRCHRDSVKIGLYFTLYALKLLPSTREL